MITTEKQYQTSFETCQQLISGVCSCCGGELKPIETVDNSDNPTWWSGCESCNRFDWGIDKEVFEIARELVDNNNYIHYNHMDPPYDKEPAYKDYYRKTQIGGASTLVQQIFRLQKRLREQKAKTL